MSSLARISLNFIFDDVLLFLLNCLSVVICSSLLTYEACDQIIFLFKQFFSNFRNQIFLKFRLKLFSKLRILIVIILSLTYLRHKFWKKHKKIVKVLFLFLFSEYLLTYRKLLLFIVNYRDNNKFDHQKCIKCSMQHCECISSARRKIVTFSFPLAERLHKSFTNGNFFKRVVRASEKGLEHFSILPNTSEDEFVALIEGATNYKVSNFCRN